VKWLFEERSICYENVQHLKKKWLDKRYVFEIWSAGGFTTASLELLKKDKEKTKKYEIDYFGKNEIIAKEKELQSPKLRDLLKEYYFKDL